MRANAARDLIASGGTVVNGWLSCDSGYVAEALSYAGLDAVTVDHQHGMYGLDRAVSLLQAVSAGPAVPMARCSRLDHAEIGKLLDAGAYGIICPSIDDADQCARLVDACRYPPTGSRSFGPARGLLYGGPDYVENADGTVQVWAMVESRAALEHLDAIVAVPGLDGVYVGPNDLALSLGHRPGDPGARDDVEAAMERVLGTAHAAGVAVGTFCADLPTAERRARAGFDLVTPGNDVALLREAVTHRADAVRSAARSGSVDAEY